MSVVTTGDTVAVMIIAPSVSVPATAALTATNVDRVENRSISVIAIVEAEPVVSDVRSRLPPVSDQTAPVVSVFNSLSSVV